MNTKSISFPNFEGQQLSAKLDLPVDQHPKTFAIFSHCFTCNKNLSAVRNISQSLTQNGIGVLRFDFTGLGDSEGDFSDTNFSTSVDDLIAAAKFLENNYVAPSLMVGHSLGGAAVIFAGSRLDSIKAIATIGAPSDPEHVQHLLKEGMEEIQQLGEATVRIGGRPFKVKKQLIDDLNQQAMYPLLKHLRKGLLVMHSPQDKIVDISNAARIYETAYHPKSFVSLDGADHLMSNPEDSRYAGTVIAAWAKKYIKEESKAPDLKTDKDVVVSIGDKGYTTEMLVGKHYMVADEPEDVGGFDFGPSPYGYLTAALGACTAMTLRLYADHKQLEVEEINIHLSHSKSHMEDCENCEADNQSKIDHFDREIEIKGNLTEAQRNRMLEIADKCPVHRTLHEEVKVSTKLK
ncbi:alpha/beta fold hydrolase [Limibacter armeniacum]|uniref:bifunctional alpha/beta hydrolase/OsmC family protein n=1 Tax=Limibacter armeniacum TaxID=466084 RepID=UPI002FE5261F